MYKITAVQIRDFQRVREARIEPDADAALILIGGPNAQGKTSILNAMSCALGGANALPPEPVRRGADEAEIIVELAGRGADCTGPLVVRRRVTPDGKTTLEVREDGVAVRGPQTVLNRLRQSRFLDPLEFLSAKPPEQRAKLLAIIGNADRLEELGRKRKRAFDKRTEVGRNLKHAEGELERTPEVTPDSPIDAAALTLESRQIEQHRLTRVTAEARVTAARRNLSDATAEVERVRRILEHAQDHVITCGTEVNAATAALDALEPVNSDRQDEILFELRRAQAHNDKVAADRAQVARRSDVVAAVERLRQECDACTDAIAEIDRRKSELLEQARLPVEGLGIDDDGVTYNGHPLAQASGAERHRIALGIAMAAAPELGDVWIRDGSLLDDESVALVVAAAEAAGVRVWLERVGTRDDGAIVIRDGRIDG